MGRKVIDLVNQQFGNLIVLVRDMSRPSGAGKAAYWLCECACGNITSVETGNLQRATVIACGCLRGMGGRKHGTDEKARQAAVARATNWNRENTKKRAAILARYHKNHRAAATAKENKRRAAKLNQTCDCCKNDQFNEIYEFSRLVGMEVDHIRPLARGGAHCTTNLQLLPPEINRAKGAKLLI